MVELQIGRVIKPHGVKGEVVVDSTTDQPELRFAPGTVLRGRHRGQEIPLTVRSTRPHQGRLLLLVEEITDRSAAETLRGMCFFAEPISTDADDDSYYDHELQGLRVLSVGAVDEATAYARAYDGALPEPEDIGVVSEVSHGPAGTMLHVTIDSSADGDAEQAAIEQAGHARVVLIPFRTAIVPIVDIDNQALVITPPEGLLEL